MESVHLLSNGLFAVNKVKHVTSSQVLERLKEILRNGVASCPDPLKLGHGGTLDNTATGVLVVGVGYGCKALPKLLHGQKSYRVTGRLGISTDTYNETGAVVSESSYDHITGETICAALRKFRGNIMQTPPRYSALKQGGQRLSDLTRAGIEVSVKPRPVMCYSLRLKDFSPPTFSLEVTCGGGFYVRSLIHDLGVVLKSDAHVEALHRSQHGPFTEEEMLQEENWTATNMLMAIKQSYLRHPELRTQHKRLKDVWEDRN